MELAYHIYDWIQQGDYPILQNQVWLKFKGEVQNSCFQS